jgi:O-antigen biosynthesis protein
VSRDRRRPAHRELILESGLIDREWVAAQLGTVLATDAEAVDRYLDGDGDCSPHPLFEGQWYDASSPWRARGQDALSWYLADERARANVSPHPLVDVEQIVAAHPAAATDPHGPLSWWVGQADARTPVPVPDGVPPVRWGPLRAAALEAAERRGATSGIRLAPRRTRKPPETVAEPAYTALPESSEEPLVSVVLVVHDEGPRLHDIVDTVLAQTYRGWELVVVDDGSTDDTAALLTGIAAFDPRVVAVTLPRGGPGRARNAALDKARGRYVAFVDGGHAWHPDFLREMLAHLETAGGELAHAAMRLRREDGEWYRAVDGGRAHLLALEHVDLAAVVARRDLLARVGGFDEALDGAEALDVLLRLTADAELTLVRTVLLDRLDHAGRDDLRWTAKVLERHLVDWQSAQQGPRQEGRLSIVLHGGPDLDRTVRWVTRTMSRFGSDADVELVVVGSRLPHSVELPLAMLLAAYPNARLLAPLARVGPAVCTNLGIAETSGDVVVLARTTANPPRDGFRALTSALGADEVAIAQPLVVDRPGLVVSAGAVFGPGRPNPEPFLAGHPVRDAEALTDRHVPAPLSPVIAVRASALVQLRGFDPRAGDPMPEVDLGLRAAREGLGHTVVVTEAPLVLKAGQMPRLDSGADAVLALQALWHTSPAGSEDAWARAGFEVVGRSWEDRSRAASLERDPLDVPSLTPRTWVRPARPEIDEGPPRLRWALDIAAPSGRRGQRWGDMHFARSMAEALERLGQRVAIDTRDLRHRDSRDLDDVVLVLRGLDRVAPRPGRVNLEWVISHPDLVTAEELAGFERVYAASTTWASETTAATGITVTPLLQCTDPRLFNPGRAAPDSGPAVLFVGNSRAVYRKAVRTALAAGAEVEVHGLDWEEFLPAQLVKSKLVANEDLGTLYASAGIVLNDHWDDMRRDGFLANRLFDVTACAARLVTDEIPGLTETFGDAVLTFHDEQEMGPILADPEAAFPSREARLALAETVMREHSFDHRAEVLLDDAARLLAR